MKAIMTIIICLFVSSLPAQNLIVPAPQSQEAIARHFEDLADETNSLDLYYSAACHWSLAGDHENAFRCLFFLAKNGFCELEWLENEDDLLPLRSTPIWRLVILHVKSNIKEKKSAQLKIPVQSKADKPENADVQSEDTSDTGMNDKH